LTGISFSDYISEYLKCQESERQQATVRILFAVFLSVFAYTIYMSGKFDDISDYFIYCFSTYLLASIAILVSIIFFPSFRGVSRKIGIATDLSFITFSMLFGGAVAAFIYGGYLWVTIANGLRFGVRYLRVAHKASMACFSVVLLLSPYWQENIVLGLGLWMWLLLLPIYVSKLLHILENAVQAANNANKAKSTFLANMSHEIRTPLTAIIGYAEVSLDSNQTMQERSKALKIIVSSGNHLLNIINDILDFSKVEADQLDVEHMTVDLFQLVADVESIMRCQAENKHLGFNVLYDFPLPEKFVTDPVRLKQILLNLCSNAIKFTDEGAVSISISCDDDLQILQFCVKDTGIGITSEQLQKLFKPFQQANSSITRRFGGTGLGLSLSIRLAEVLGGTIAVTSEPGQGSRFALTTSTGSLQKEQFIQNVEQITSPGASDKSVVKKELLSGRILLAEDNPINQELLSLFLRKMGGEVDVADNGEIAVRKAKQNHYDLIYMDMQMPVLSGIDAIKMLRGLGCDQPIVVLTANATNKDKTSCINIGCNDFLTKPVSREILYEMSSRYLQIARQADQYNEAITSTMLAEEPELRDLVEKFVSELPGILDEVHHACQQQDWKTLRKLIHDLKGMGGGFGYDVLTELTGKAEFQLFSENYEAVKTLLDEISHVSERIYEGSKLREENVIELKINTTD